MYSENTKTGESTTTSFDTTATTIFFWKLTKQNIFSRISKERTPKENAKQRVLRKGKFFSVQCIVAD